MGGDGLQSLRIVAAQNAIVERFESDALLTQLALEPLMAIEAKLGVVGEIRAELEKEGAEIPILAVEVIMVHQGRGADQPGIALPSVRIIAALGAEYDGFLLGFAHEHDPLVPREAGPVLRGNIILALTSLEGNQRNVVLLDKSINGGEKSPAQRLHQSAAGDFVATMLDEKTNHSTGGLEQVLIDVQVEPVDRLQFKRDVIAEERNKTETGVH